ncbi:DUF3348 domain-containing protein [Lysobacter sp. CA199]|uniref:DUF3348 domain-containing protein n=1 Tax=Lysobacter sp. CA199 TaxID=3455608 RepID=UPI003F8D57F4
MMEAPRRAPVRGPTFIRVLARLTAADVPPPPQSLSDQLSQWIDWTHAVALSTALDGKPPAPLLDDRILSSADENECARVRAALAAAIAADPAFAAPKRESTPVSIGNGATAASAAVKSADYAFFRQRYQAMQQAMEAGVGRLRERLRAMLTHGTVEMARLAAVDAVMERALSRRERSLLSGSPALLADHFERLRQAAHEAQTQARDDTSSAASDTWLDVFRKDMRNVLLAELDVRLQPAEGLLAALRTASHG